MVGIVSYGSYVPLFRMSRKTISAAMGWLNQYGSAGERAVANYDEDSLTMAVAAGMDCLKPVDRGTVDNFSFATTTPPYVERESAAIIATALDLSTQIRSTDFAHSLKAGTGALLFACDSVKSGGARNAMVCAADCRLGKPGCAQETIFGDGAAACLVGSQGVMASLEGAYSVSYDFPDHWRAWFDKYDRTAEDRWIRDEGYSRFIPEAVKGLLKKYHLEPKSFAKVIYPATNARDHAGIGKAMGFEPGQIQEPLLAMVGDAGSAASLMMLVAALEDAKPGDNLLVASHGGGSDALWFKVTGEIEKKKGLRGIKKYIATKREMATYEQYLAYRGIIPIEVGLRGEVGTTQIPLAWRERKTILALYGTKCKRCGTPQYPPQRVCVNPECGAIDEIEEYRFADKKGTLFSYTQDRLAFSYSPPQTYGMVDFEGGGRFLFDLTDYDPKAVKVGLPVEMTFRRKYLDEVRGIVGYTWRAMPIRE